MAELDVTGWGSAEGAQEDVFAVDDAITAAQQHFVITFLIRDGERVAAIVPADAMIITLASDG